MALAKFIMSKVKDMYVQLYITSQVSLMNDKASLTMSKVAFAKVAKTKMWRILAIQPQSGLFFTWIPIHVKNDVALLNPYTVISKSTFSRGILHQNY